MAFLTFDGHERAVRVHGHTWTWDDVQAERPGLAALAVVRRDRDAANFDRWHPLLGYLMAGEPVTPPCVPVACVPPSPPPVPPAVVPGPSTGPLVALGLACVLGRLALRRLGVTQ